MAGQKVSVPVRGLEELWETLYMLGTARCYRTSMHSYLHLAEALSVVVSTLLLQVVAT